MPLVARTVLHSAFGRSGLGLVRASAQRLSPQFVRFYAAKDFPQHNVLDMPALSPTMTQGNIGTWQKKPGDKIDPGDVLVEIETDKAQMDFECQEEGYLAKILVDDGAKDVQIGKPIAVMVEEEGDVKAFENFTLEDAPSSAAPGKSKEAQPKEKEEFPKKDKKETSLQKDESPSKPKQPSSSPPPAANRVAASPLARRLANEKGIPLNSIKGTGPSGRVIERDIQNYKSSGAAPAATPGSTAASYKDIPLTGMRKTIGSRLQASWVTSPHYYLTSSLDMTKLVKLRAALNENSEVRISVNDFLVKAIAIASKKVPAVNSAWMEEESVIREFSNVDVSVAVATPTGLVTPIIFGANALGLEAISTTIKELGKRARDNKLKPQEYQGGTVTISNLGMNDAVESFTAIINPPQSCILAVGSIQSAGDSQKCKVTASFDHRVVDGFVGAQWIKELKRVIEDPLRLML